MENPFGIMIAVAIMAWFSAAFVVVVALYGIMWFIQFMIDSKAEFKLRAEERKKRRDLL